MHTLIVFMAGRKRPGSLAVAARKRGVILLEGSGEAEVRAAWASSAGLLLTLTGFEVVPDAQGRRVQLPESVTLWLEEAVAGQMGDAVEIAILDDGSALRGRTQVSIEHVRRPLVVGHRYQIAPLGPLRA
ncbi:MAG: hypothetical protein ACE366_01880 [Bradymonadia bacterium]